MKKNHLTEFNLLFRASSLFKSALVLMLFCSQVLSAQSFTEARDPEQELTALGTKFVELLNISDEQEALRLGKEVFKESSARDWVFDFRKDYGPVSFGRIRLTVGDKYQTVHVIVKVEKLNLWRNFQLVFDNNQPKRCGRVNIVLAARPLTLSPGLITEPKVMAELNSYIDELEAGGMLSGTLLITKGQRPLLERSFGMANRETKRPVTGDTPFNLASGGKMFTSVAILRLAQAGKIDMNDPMSKFLPNYPDQTLAQRVTVANLLSHTSGIGDYWDDEYEKHWDKINDLSDYLPFIASKPLLSLKSGEGFYSNSNFILLGLIIESVSGQDYYSHIEETILKPLSMDHTGFYGKGQDDIFAVGYLDLGDGKTLRSRGGGRGSAAGGVYSTARDMFKFRNALVEGQLLNKEMLKLATAEHVLLDGDMRYGYGFSLGETFTQGFGHGGRGPGSSTAFDIDPATGLSLITMSNMVNGAYTELYFTVKEVLKRK